MRLLANRDYRHLLSAQVIALFGTGLTTIALGLFAYELAGPRASVVLGTALTIKMVMYVFIAPLAAAYVDKLPRRMFLVLLDVVRAGVVLALPFITEVWHVYVLIGLLQAASAAFTPTFQAVIPDIVTDKEDYTRALSASQVAYTMESLLSPVLAAIALSFMTFNWLFVGTSIGFVISAAFVMSTRIPNAQPSAHANAWDRASAGIKRFARTPRLRGVMALNMVVAAAGSIVIVNTVNYVRDNLGGSQADVAWMLAASGCGTLLVALVLPRILKRTNDRTVMMAGASVLVLGTLAAVTMTATGLLTMTATAIVWVVIGSGMALVVTPTGRVLRGSVEPNGIPEVFAAQFSLSHLAWLITYPIAGWLGTMAGFTLTWSILAALAAAGTIAALSLWPRHAEVEDVPVVAEPERSASQQEADMRIGAGANATIVNAPAANTSVAGGPAALENSAQRSAAGREAGVAEGTLSACQCAMMRTN
ncbi:MFS transporter [Rothia endophytica]|uniref:MFS transporter n=1 Tax=Rothia endophytica TaxID=1324766 RepID=A0ABP9BPA4_9MICC